MRCSVVRWKIPRYTCIFGETLRLSIDIFKTSEQFENLQMLRSESGGLCFSSRSWQELSKQPLVTRIGAAIADFPALSPCQFSTELLSCSTLLLWPLPLLKGTLFLYYSQEYSGNRLPKIILRNFWNIRRFLKFLKKIREILRKIDQNRYEKWRNWANSPNFCENSRTKRKILTKIG